MLGNVLSRLMGLVREQVIGAVFGATAATDAFTVAATVPTMVYDLLVSGAISAALIPVFTDYADREDQEELSRVVSAVLTMAAAALAVVVAILMVGAPLLVAVLGGGYGEEVQTVIVYLVRLMLPAVLFMGTSGVLTAALYARQSFTLPAFSVSVYNLGVVLGAVLLSGQLGVTSLVIGVVTGAVLQVAIQLPGMRGLRLLPRLDLSHPGVRAILKLYAPVAVGLIVSNIGVIIDRNLASHTGEGSIAAMRFATTLAQFPLGLVATATSFAILPTLSRHASSVISHQSSVLGPQSSAYTATLKMGMKMVLVLIVPAAVGLAVLREPVVQLIFQRQAFDASATALTALAFLGYSPGIVFNAVDQLFIFAFYARKDTRTPVAVGIMAVFVYLAVALPLVRPLGMLGLVLANSAQWTSHALVLLWLLNRRVAGVIDADIGVFLLKVAAASAVMGIACEVGLAVAGPLASTGPGVAALVAGEAALGGAVYAGAVVLLRVREAHQVWRMVEARIRRR